NNPSHNRFAVLIALAHGLQEFGILRACLWMFIVYDVRTPSLRMKDSLTVDGGRMHGIPIRREPVRRPLISDERNQTKATLFASADKVIVIGPIELIIAICLDMLPNEVHPQTVSAKFDHLI